MVQRFKSISMIHHIRRVVEKKNHIIFIIDAQSSCFTKFNVHLWFKITATETVAKFAVN